MKLPTRIPFCILIYFCIHLYINVSIPHTYRNIYIIVKALVYLETREYSTMVILFDRLNLPENAFETIFSTSQQKIVAKELIKYIIANKGQVTKTEMSLFATELHEGKYETVLNEPGYKGKTVKLSYNKRQFYDRILTPMKAMGLIDYDLYKKNYKISVRFTQDMMQIGILWKTTLKRMGYSV